MEHTKDELVEILERRLDRLETEHREVLALLEELLDRMEEPEPVIEDKARWMRGARKELSTLIREVEGPRPRQGGR
jgi:prefoldin subunit 5